MSKIIVYHNTRCSKSRSACEFLAEHGVEPLVVEYLATPPNADELEKIINKLGITAGELVRKSEPIYKEKYLGKKLTNKQWIKAMVKYPILIERPIIIKGKKAIIGRPVERILELL